MTNLLVTALSQFGVDCHAAKGIQVIPTWYEYLPLKVDVTNRCAIDFDTSPFPENLPLIALGIVDILLRIAAFAAIGYVVYGGIQYVLSQGEPDKISGARRTITNALIGLVLALLATGIVTFIGNQLT